MTPLASEGACAMLRKTMIVLATAAALTGGLTADALARGGGAGGGGHGGGGAGARIGGVGRFRGSGGAFARGAAGHRFVEARGHFGHEGHFRGRRFVPGFYDYDYGCSYGYSSCYPPSYY